MKAQMLIKKTTALFKLFRWYENHGWYHNNFFCRKAVIRKNCEIHQWSSVFDLPISTGRVVQVMSCCLLMCHQNYLLLNALRKMETELMICSVHLVTNFRLLPSLNFGQIMFFSPFHFPSSILVQYRNWMLIKSKQKTLDL